MPLLSWKITNDCNYHCRYHLRDAQSIEIDAAPAVLQFLESTDTPWKISITGGEPFLAPNFVEVCRQITENHFISIDTNLSISTAIASFADCVNPAHVDLILAALHIEEREKFDNGAERFIKDVQLLQSKGFHVKVIYVLYPPLIERFEQDFHYFKSRGITLIPKPFKGIFKNALFPASYEKDAYAIFSKYGQDNLKEKLVYNFKGILCQAGQNLISLNQAGRITRCPSDKMPMGYLGEKKLDEVVFKTPKPCPVSQCYCFGAAYALIDAARVHFLEGIQHFLKQDYQSARHSFQEAIEHQPNLDSAYYNLAVVDTLTDNQQSAIAWLKKAVHFDPENSHYSMMLDNLLKNNPGVKNICDLSTDLSLR